MSSDSGRMYFMDNRILIDWFACSFSVFDVQDVIDFLGLSEVDFQDINGMNGYRSRKYFGGISIHYDGAYGSYLEMSGKGCRMYEELHKGENFNWYDFSYDILNYDKLLNITRVDVAFDDFTGILDMPTIMADVRAKNWVSRFTSYEIRESHKGLSVYVGSQKSDCFVRFYDKAQEQGVDYHWTRLEFQLRNENARGFLKKYLLNEDISEVFLGVLVNYLRFVVPSSDSNKSRWVLTDYWKNLVGDVSRIRLLETLGADYSYEQLTSFVINQAGGAIQTLIKILGADDFLEMVGNRDRPISPKHLSVLDSHNVLQAKISVCDKNRTEQNSGLLGLNDSNMVQDKMILS